MLARGLTAVAATAILLVAATAAQETSAVLNAPMLREERIDVPTGAATVQGPWLVLNAKKDGWILLLQYFDYGILFDDCTAVAVDANTGEAERYTIPKGLNISMALERGATDDRGRHYVYYSGEGVGELWRFDPADMTFRSLGAPPFDRGGGYGKIEFFDGKVYGTVNSLGEVGVWQYDTKAEAFKSYGFISPKQTQGGETHGYSLTVAGDWVYVAVGKVPWRLVALDTRTGKAEQILEAPAGNSQIFLMDGHAIRRPDPDAPNKMERWDLRDGKAVLTDEAWTFGKRPRRAPDPVARPKIDRTALEPTGDGETTIRWQLPGEERPREVTLKVKVYPQAIRRLVALPDGRLMGSIGSYKGCFLYDPKDGKSVNTPIFQLSQYATLVHDGKVWMSGYPGAPVFVFDPALPMKGLPQTKSDAPDANPRLVASLEKSWAHKMWGAAAGSDGAVYFCGEVARQGNGGAVGWWDPVKQEAGAAPHETFFGQQTLYACAVDGGRTILFNAHVTIDNRTGKMPGSAETFVFDVATRTVTDHFAPVDGAKMLGPMVALPGGKVLSAANLDSYGDETQRHVLYVLDIASRRVERTKPLPAFLCAWHHGLRGGQEFEIGPDGKLWTYLGPVHHPETPTLVRIDTTTLDIQPVGRVAKRGPMAFVGRDLYRGCEHKAGELELRRIADIVPQN